MIFKKILKKKNKKNENRIFLLEKNRSIIW